MLVFYHQLQYKCNDITYIISEIVHLTLTRRDYQMASGFEIGIRENRQRQMHQLCFLTRCKAWPLRDNSWHFFFLLLSHIFLCHSSTLTGVWKYAHKVKTVNVTYPEAFVLSIYISPIFFFFGDRVFWFKGITIFVIFMKCVECECDQLQWEFYSISQIVF